LHRTPRQHLRRVRGGLLAIALLFGGALPRALATEYQETPAPEEEPPLSVEPADDPFYRAPEAPAHPRDKCAPRCPSALERAKPGTILRVRPMTVTAFRFPVPVEGWQLLVRSTDSAGAPVAVVTSILLPLVPWVGGERPLFSHQAAIDALGDQCMPSYELRTGTHAEALSLVPALLAGWVVVTTDFEGPRHAYGAGPMAGQAVLDGIRAATRFAPAGLDGDATPVGLMGYSGGGQATTWAAELQPTYAPELNVVGVAGGGVPADLNAVARHLDGALEAGIAIAAGVGIHREFPSMAIDDLVNERGRQLIDSMSDACIEEFAASAPGVRWTDLSDVDDPLALPQIVEALAANSLGKTAPTAPMYLYHSVADQLIPVAVADQLARHYCAEGVAPVFYDRSVAGEHIAYAVLGAPGAYGFLASRFAGVAAPDNCALLPVIAPL
jgi:hypothetical protein